MGFRARLTKKLGPFRVTLSKSGISYSLGGKGSRYTVRADGKRQITLGAPGSGLYYTEILKSGEKKSPNRNTGKPVSFRQRDAIPSKQVDSKHAWLDILIAVGLIALLPIAIIIQFIPILNVIVDFVCACVCICWLLVIRSKPDEEVEEAWEDPIFDQTVKTESRILVSGQLRTRRREVF